MQDEARNNLMFGILTALVEESGRFPEFHLWVVADQGRPVLAALRTPPWNLLVSGPARPDAIAELARSLHEEGHPLPGVTGAVPEGDAFAEEWGRLTGAGTTVSMEQGVYQLTAVRPASAVEGAPRDVSAEARGMLIEWLKAFHEEADPTGPGDPEQMVDSRLSGASGGLVVWEVNGEPVSVAGFVGGTPNGARIGPVYTPPKLRGRGYATALVAWLSQKMLDAGRRFCFLYTDMANPTSNRIYRRIGYELVCDSRMYRFESR
jgi:uncharacterized protein